MLAKWFVSKTLRRMHRDCKVHIEAGNIWKYALSFENEFQISGPLKLKYCHFQFGLKIVCWKNIELQHLCINGDQHMNIIPRGYGYMVWNMQRSWRGNSFSFVFLLCLQLQTILEYTCRFAPKDFEWIYGWSLMSNIIGGCLSLT